MISCRPSRTPAGFGILSADLRRETGWGDVTITAYGEIKPVIRRYCSRTPCATATTPNVAIASRVEWRMCINPVLRGQLPVSESRCLGFSYNDCAVIN